MTDRVSPPLSARAGPFPLPLTTRQCPEQGRDLPMKPTADEDDILTGEDAIDHMVDTWQDVGMGMVEVEQIGVWFMVRRAGGDYSTFISLVDDTAVTILSNDATTHHIPKDLRPDAEVPSMVQKLLNTAFENATGGMYPLAGKGVFAIPFTDDGEKKQLEIAFYDGTVEVNEDP